MIEMTELQFSKKHMVDVRKKTIRDYLYNDIVRKSVFVLFCASLFFFGLMYGYGYIESPRFFPFMAVILVYLLLDPEVKGNIIDFPFMIISLTYLLMSVHQIMINPAVTEKYDPIPYAWVVPAVYMLGKMIIGNSKENVEKKIFAVLLSLGIGMYIQGILNYSESLYGYDLNRGHVWRTFWYSDIDGAITLYNYGFLIIGVMLFYSVIAKNKNVIICSTIMVAVSMAIDAKFMGRTMLVIPIMFFVIMALFYHVTDLKRLAVSLVSILVIILVVSSKKFLCLLPNQIQHMFNRDGGIIHNVRFEMMKLGISRAIENPRGNWAIDDVFPYATPHNSWLEFARQYDIVIFFLWCFYLVVVLIIGIRLLLLHGKNNKIIYWLESCELVFITIGMIEPYMTERLELLLFPVFICGLVAGVDRVVSSSDYYRIGEVIRKRVCSRSIIGTAILSTALIICGYMSWRDDRLQVLIALVVPIGAFLIGCMVQTYIYRIVIICITAICCMLSVIYMYFVSVGSEFFLQGFWVEIYTGAIVDKSVVYALLIIPASLLVGRICTLINIKKTMLVGLVTIVTGILMSNILMDGRINAMKEAIRLQLSMKSGGQWIASKENYNGLISSHSMWLDFARDYGMVVFGLLLFFELWSIMCFAKCILNDNKSMCDYTVIVAFILYNYYFMFESTAISSKYLLSLGMFIYGMVISASEGCITNDNLLIKIIKRNRVGIEI